MELNASTVFDMCSAQIRLVGLLVGWLDLFGLAWLVWLIGLDEWQEQDSARANLVEVRSEVGYLTYGGI